MRGTGKINKAPKGKSFFYRVMFTYGPTRCSYRKGGCKGHIRMTGGYFPSAIGNSTFKCTKCKRFWPDLRGMAAYKAKVYAELQRKMNPPRKKVKFQPDSPELTAAVRAEVKRRTKILIAEREKFPPTHTFKASGKRDRWVTVGSKRVRKGGPICVPNKKMTTKLRAEIHAHMKPFGFSAVKIRDELLAKGMK